MPQKLSSYLKKLSSEHLTLKIQGGFISLGYIEMCHVNEQPLQYQDPTYSISIGCSKGRSRSEEARVSGELGVAGELGVTSRDDEWVSLKSRSAVPLVPRRMAAERQDSSDMDLPPGSPAQRVLVPKTEQLVCWHLDLSLLKPGNTNPRVHREKMKKDIARIKKMEETSHASGTLFFDHLANNS